MGKMKDYIDNDEGSPTAADLYLEELKRTQVELYRIANRINEMIDNVGGK